MATENTKGPGSRSMIPVPRTFSLQRLRQTQSIDNLAKIAGNKSPGCTRRVTRHSSVSRLPISKPVVGKTRPLMSRASNSSCDLTSIASTNYQTNSIKSRVIPKIFKPNDSQVNCLRYQKYHNNNNSSQTPCRTTTPGFKYNKFSPYYENESIDSQTSDNQKQTDFDCISSVSSVEESANSSRGVRNRPQNGIPYHCQQRSDSRQSMGYRTRSVPEHIHNQFKYQSIDSNSPKTNETVNKLLIETLKNRIIESIDNEEEEKEFDEQDFADDQAICEMPQNVETRLLRIVIRHLREKLSQTKTNLEDIKQQLASNKQMCEAFQKSLSTMTIRAQHLTQELDCKQTELDAVCHQLKDKTLDYEELNKKYSYLETEYKNLQKNNTIINNNSSNGNRSRTDSSLSTMSYRDSADGCSTPVNKHKTTSSWLKGSTLSKAFKRRKKLNIFSNSSSDLLSTKEAESVSHLRDLIREKELTISDLKLESLATTNRLERLEGDLKNSRDETTNLKKNKDFLEKMIKMKIIE